jgi:hypothetical protein
MKKIYLPSLFAFIDCTFFAQVVFQNIIYNEKQERELML